MLYSKNLSPTLSDDLFRNPTAEYRGTPFWSWNDLLTKEELERQIDIFRAMGLGGFHMHVRTGLKNRYLSDEFMALVRACVDKAKANEMLAWLYDEDRWPSGAAGGLVTKDPRFRARALYFTNNEAETEALSEGDRLIACYDVSLGEDGTLKSYSRINKDDAAKDTKWYAVLKISTPSSWYNGQTYVDTLNKEAIEQFVHVTHERFKEAVGDEFGKTVPAIFTDEPQFTSKTTLKNSITNEKEWVRLPWTDKVPELYRNTYGEDILATLPELIWELPDGKISVPRYRFHDFITELFAASFADTIGSWCSQNGIALTGHMMEEPSLRSQTAIIGEAMRSYRSFGSPGIDMLCNYHEFTTAKQAQSAAHQFGKPGVLSELYGVTSWDADFRLYKHQGDWQAALGVSVRVPHLSWYSMQGEAKRDYPASISYQSAWHTQWHLLEDHFARVNTALTRGKPKVKVAVIHPVESFWLHWGPNDKTAGIREDMDDRFRDLTDWLLEGMIDFDFLSESLLPLLCEKGGAPLQAGEMRYETIVVPACETLRSTTLERLEAFRAAGGRLIFLGKAPTLENAVPSGRGQALFAQSEQVEFARAALLQALDSDRFITVRRPDGRLANGLLHQMRTDTDGDWLFLAHTGEPDCKDLSHRKDIVLTVKGTVAPILYDTQSGETYPLGADYKNGCTVIKTALYDYDSLLLKLVPGKAEQPAGADRRRFRTAAVVDKPLFYSLGENEQNVLLLDAAEYALDDGAFAPKKNILQLDNLLRDRIGLPRRGGHVVQPYTIADAPTKHTITLRFLIQCEAEVRDVCLALEDPEVSVITLNGEEVSNATVGNYVDIAIKKVPLPGLKQGENTLTVTQPFGARTNPEAMYLLGDFGVRINGTEAVVTAKPKEILFSDLTMQGFPFYGGPMRYGFKATAKNGELTVHASFYRGGLIRVLCDGKEAGAIIYPPFDLTIKNLSDGEHEIVLELLLHRYNTFGPVHLVDEKRVWHGPDAWRSEGDDWSDGYLPRRTGILKAPEVLEREE